MPRLPDPVVFAIGAEVDESRVARWLAGAEPAGPARTVEQALLDTFDGRLYRRGLVMWREGSRRAPSLRLQQAGAADLSGRVESGDPDRILVADLPEGVLNDRLADLIGERALQPRVRIRTRTRPWRVCNGDGKTVVRMAVEEPAVVGGRGVEADLGRRLRVVPVLGYPRDMERAVAALERRLEHQPMPLAEAALAAAGVRPEGVSSDVEVPLVPEMRADIAIAAICRRLAEIVDDHKAGVVADIDPEFLHDMRVAVRRSRAVLKEMRGVLTPEQAARARSDLKWIQEITGPTRDLDVLLHEWPSMVEPVPTWMGPDLGPLLDLLRRERAEAYSTMRRHLTSRRFAAAWSAWQELIAESAPTGSAPTGSAPIGPSFAGPSFAGPEAGRPIGELAGRRIVAVYRSMARAGAAIDDDSPPEALHDLRKRGKELRYLLELFGCMWPEERVKPLVGALKGLQDVLGHFQDDEIQALELRGLGPVLAATPGGTDSLIALGFVIEELTRRQHQARADFATRFSDFAAPANRKRVTGTFR
ncbi:MAG: CHAD domain-containing protein [Actinomycetota bacterium]|nr:CHAD domain-containing protein [Actinomycetota bacterium]